MGLDMYLFRTNKKMKEEEIIQALRDESQEQQELIIEEGGYWRKHSDLHGVMRDLYVHRGGEKIFNCIPLILDKQDCQRMLHLATEIFKGKKESPTATGFFWGESTIEKWKQTIDIFDKVLNETDFDNQTVFYDSWW